MRVRLVLAALALLSLAAPALAHRLDEYLQATTIAVARGHIAIRLHLTPGADIAPALLAAIDADGDGAISAAEQHAYVEQVRRDLTLTVDGGPTPLRLVSASFPPVAAMRAGSGDMLIAFEAGVPATGSRHRLRFENRHRTDIAVYLVNTLLPDDPAIRIVAQQRSYDQSTYRLDYALDAPGAAQGAADRADRARALDRADSLSAVETYFRHGLRHILTGYDHLLFVAALTLGAATLWDLVKVVTAFTVAHSITLTLAALRLVHLPPDVVEPLIAASIVFVAVQNILWPGASRGWSRLAVAFGFGLFHGLGFAGGLEVMHQLPSRTILLAILGFSLGVEAGNQLVLLPLFGALKAARSTQRNTASRTDLARTLQRIGSIGIAAAGICYLTVMVTDML